MRLYKIAFSMSSFSRLSDPEQLLFLQLSHIHNDLRHIHHLVIRSLNGLRDSSDEIHQDIVLHQHIFSLRLWYGTLCEAWKVIARDWYDLKPLRSNTGGDRPRQLVRSGAGLATKLATSLDTDGQQAAEKMLHYFTATDNLVYKIRNKFAFHYDADLISHQVKALSEEETQFFVSSERSGNIFYTFAEKVRYMAIANSADPTDAAEAIQRVYDELVGPHDWLDQFSRSTLLAIANRCDMSREPFDSDSVTDLSKIQPVVFSDEDAVARTLKQKGLLG